MHRLTAIAALAAACLAVPGVADAQSTPSGTYVFSTVDEVGQLNLAFTVVGLLQGEATPTTLSATTVNTGSAVDLVATQCQRYALLAQAKPGQYQLLVTVQAPYLSACRLRRVVP